MRPGECSTARRPALASAGGLRRGFTLIELMVVVVVIMAVTVLSIRMFNPNTQQRRIREAARMVDTFVQGARDRAAQLGRPVGVMLERVKNIPEVCSTLSYAETPPAFSGDSFFSRAKVSNWTVTAVVSVSSNGTETAETGWQGLVQAGDLVQFNYQGALYRITAADSSGGTWTFAATWTDPTGNAISPNFPSGVPFQVYRRPLKSADSPLTLPDGVVIDLMESGTDVVTAFAPLSATDTAPVMLMFQPGGSVDRVYFDAGSGNTAFRPMGPVYLLVSTAGKAAASQSLQDLNNLWVTVFPQTGRVKTDEMASTTASGAAGQLEARRFARTPIAVSD